MNSGKFITFEGGEGTGKSTQVTMLAARLEVSGWTVLQTREPGGTPQAEQIRSLLVSGETDRWSPKAEALLNYAARDSHILHGIQPALIRGDWVISDRYMDSTRAYQGHAGGVSADFITELEHQIVGNVVPDLTFVMDIAPEAGLARAAARMTEAPTQDTKEDRFEAKGLAFHTSLRQAFLDIARDNVNRCVVIDASNSIEQVSEIVWREVVSRLAP